MLIHRLPVYLHTDGVIRYALGKSGAIVAITPNILGYMGWLMESGKTWDNSRGKIS